MKTLQIILASGFLALSSISAAEDKRSMEDRFSAQIFITERMWMSYTVATMWYLDAILDIQPAASKSSDHVERIELSIQLTKHRGESMTRSIEARPKHEFREKHLGEVKSVIEDALAALQATKKYLETGENASRLRAKEFEQKVLQYAGADKASDQRSEQDDDAN